MIYVNKIVCELGNCDFQAKKLNKEELKNLALFFQRHKQKKR